MFKLYSKLSSECFSVIRGEQLISVVYDLFGVIFLSHHSVYLEVVEVLCAVNFSKGQVCGYVIVPINYHPDTIVFDTCNRIFGFW